MRRDEAAALTMTEFQLLLAAKYPIRKGSRKTSTTQLLMNILHVKPDASPKKISPSQNTKSRQSSLANAGLFYTQISPRISRAFHRTFQDDP
jgi:hypothetical protein